MSAAPAGFRPRVDGRNTTAGVSRAAAGRRPGGRSPRSGLWRAGSVSRRNTRPSRRTGTAAARSTRRRGGDRIDTRWTTVRCRGCRPRACTGVGLPSVLGRGRLVASRSSLGSVRSTWFCTGNTRPVSLGKSQHVHCSSLALMRPRRRWPVPRPRRPPSRAGDPQPFGGERRFHLRTVAAGGCCISGRTAPDHGPPLPLRVAAGQRRPKAEEGRRKGRSHPDWFGRRPPSFGGQRGAAMSPATASMTTRLTAEADVCARRLSRRPLAVRVRLYRRRQEQVDLLGAREPTSPI